MYIPATLSKEERDILHMKAERLHLHHQSSGEGTARQLKVWRDCDNTQEDRNDTRSARTLLIEGNVCTNDMHIHHGPVPLGAFGNSAARAGQRNKFGTD